MQIDLAQLLTSVIASTIAALAAGYLGVRFGLTKLRRERAFERRLQWSEDVLRALHEAGSAVVAAMDTDALSADDQETAWVEVKRLAEGRLIPLSQQKELYATKPVFEAVRGAVLRVQILLVAQAAHREANKRDDKNVLQGLMAQCVKEMRAAASTVAGEVRSHLGLERLRPEDLSEDPISLSAVVDMADPDEVKLIVQRQQP